MNNGAPRTVHGYIVTHENGAPYLQSFRSTERDAQAAFCQYWASLARHEQPRRWAHFQSQNFRVVPVVASLMGGI